MQGTKMGFFCIVAVMYFFKDFHRNIRTDDCLNLNIMVDIVQGALSGVNMRGYLCCVCLESKEYNHVIDSLVKRELTSCFWLIHGYVQTEVTICFPSVLQSWH